MSALMMKLLGHVLMNEAGDGGEGSAPAPAAAPVPAAAPDATVLTPAAADPAPAAAETKTPEQIQQESDAAKAKTDAEAKSAGAPEAYTDFTLADGVEMDADTLDSFKGLAKELNISQESAQKLIDLQSALVTKQVEDMQAAVVKQSQDWASQIYNDPELGGANFEKNAESAVKVIQAFGDPQLSELLNASGLGNHPALFKFCHRISGAISEDKFVLPGSQTDTPKEMSIVDAFR